MKRATVLRLLIGFVSMGHATGSQADFDPQARADAISPFVDEQTVLVARVDLSQVDMTASTDEAAKFLGINRDELTGSQRNRDQAEKFVKQLIAKMPAVFASSSSEQHEQGKTRFVVPVGQGTLFWGKEGTSIRDVKDGASNTILVVEVAPEHAVMWTKPDDWEVDFSDPLKGLLGDREGFIATYVDGSTRVIPKDTPAETLRRLLTIGDGQPIEGR